jgi:hypothetical protein
MKLRDKKVELNYMTENTKTLADSVEQPVLSIILNNIYNLYLNTNVLSVIKL